MTHSSTQLIEIVIRRAKSTGAVAAALKQTFRENPSISQEVRRDVARGTLGIRVFQKRLRHALGESGHGIPDQELPDDIRGAYFFYLRELEGQTMEAAQATAGLSQNEVEAVLATRNGSPLPDDPIERLATLHSLPTWIARTFVADWGHDDAAALAKAGNRAGPICFRANGSRTTRRSLAAALAAEGIFTTPSRIAPDGLIAIGRPNIRGSAAYRRGDFEVQDEASQLVSVACGLNPGVRAWDVCAGRGGKTLALAASADGVEVEATDVDAKSLTDLRVRLGRVNPKAVRVAQLPSETGAWEAAMAERAGADFDVVLVDAPCSALGTLRRSPDRRWTTEEHSIEEMAALQKRILKHAAPSVRVGGALVYATCTVTKKENEDVVADFLAAHPAFSPAPVGAVFGWRQIRRIHMGPASEHHITLSPHHDGTDGFFIARLIRERTTPTSGEDW